MTLYNNYVLHINIGLSDTLAQIDNKGPNWTFLTLKITF